MSAVSVLKRMARALCGGARAQQGLNRFSPCGQGRCACEEEPPADPCFPNVEIAAAAASTLGPNWEEVNGDWSVALMPEGPADPPTFGATVDSPSAIALADASDPAGYMSIDCQLVSVPEDSSARLLVAYENSQNYYYLEANTAANEFRVGQVSGGVDTVLHTHPTTLPSLSPFRMQLCASPAGYLFASFMRTTSSSFSRLATLDTDVPFGRVGIGTGSDWGGGAAQFRVPLSVFVQGSESHPGCPVPCGIRCQVCGIGASRLTARKVQLDISGVGNYGCDCSDLNQTFVVPILDWDIMNISVAQTNFCFGELVWPGLECGTAAPWYDRLQVRYGSDRGGHSLVRRAWFRKGGELLLNGVYQFEFPEADCNAQVTSDDVFKYNQLLSTPSFLCGSSEFVANGTCVWTPLDTYDINQNN